MKKLLIGILLVASLGYGNSTNVLNCSQFTRIWGTNGFETTLSTNGNIPTYTITNCLAPPLGQGFELVGYLVITTMYKAAVLGNNFKIAQNGNSVLAPGNWTCLKCDYDSRYINNIVSQDVTIADYDNNSTCSGFEIRTTNSFSFENYICMFQCYSRYTKEDGNSLFGQVSSPVDGTTLLQRPSSAMSITNTLCINTDNGTDNQSIIAIIYIFYANL